MDYPLRGSSPGPLRGSSPGGPLRSSSPGLHPAEFQPNDMMGAAEPLECEPVHETIPEGEPADASHIFVDLEPPASEHSAGGFPAFARNTLAMVYPPLLRSKLKDQKKKSTNTKVKQSILPTKAWLVVYVNGDSAMLFEGEKMRMISKLGLQSRDLRLLDPAMSSAYPSAILPREKVGLGVWGFVWILMIFIPNPE